MDSPLFSGTTWKHGWQTLLDRLHPARERLRNLRAQWGKPGSGNGMWADGYTRLVDDAGRGARVDAKTWNDLEFPRLFQRMDTTLTPAGRQMLFHRLHRLEPGDAEREHHYSNNLAWQTRTGLRERVQVLLGQHRHLDCPHLVEYLFAPAPATSRRKLPWMAWSLVCVAICVALFLLPVPGWVPVLVLVVNFVLIGATHWQVSRDMEALQACAALLDITDTLGSWSTAHPDMPQLAQLHRLRGQRRGMHRALRPLQWIKQPAVSWLTIWLNVLFLLDLVLLAFTIGRFFKLRDSVRHAYELIGEIDADIAMAGFLLPYPAHCRPRFSHERQLILVEGCHPLLPDGTPNTIRLVQRSALVTGSNMAGKTTFIKMLGINTILAQTSGFCLATEAVIPRADVLACIHGEHSVASGKSHYFAEVERIKSFFAPGAHGRSRLLVIDELFSGTNTVERVAIARAVLEALADKAMVLATTHDVELQGLLEKHFDFHHFREDPDVDGYFDHRLRAGTTQARNAIRMLGEMGFPEAVIARAMACAND